jgi:hypothetical protein
MQRKKFITCALLFVTAVCLLSSCAIDKKCPAYTQAPAEQGIRS